MQQSIAAGIVRVYLKNQLEGIKFLVDVVYLVRAFKLGNLDPLI